jgi:uncharacterized protein (TIRG00374 family)
MNDPAYRAARRRLWHRVRPVLAAVILGVGVFGAYERRNELESAWHLIEQAQWEWFGVAIAFELASMVAFAGLQRSLLGWGGVQVRSRDLVEITLAANAVAVSVPGGAAFAARWTYSQLRRRGAETVLAAWTVLMAGALASFALFIILAVGAWVAGNKGPVASLRALAAALALIPVAAGVFVTLLHRSRAVRTWAAEIVGRVEQHPHGHAVVHAMREFIERLRTVQPTWRGWLRAFGFATANWFANLGCLVAALLTVHGHVPWRGVLVVYGLTQLAAVLPLTPGGLAVVEGSLTALLIAYGVPSGDAVAATLLYRVVGFWAPVPLGWALYVLLSRRANREDAEAPVATPVDGHPAESHPAESHPAESHPGGEPGARRAG